MHYARFAVGDRVIVDGKRVFRTVVSVNRIAGAYEYELIGPSGQREVLWEHKLRSNG